MAGEFHLHVERAMTHILYNLDRSLTLAEVGAVSPFYFHRIFSAVAGACPNQASPRSVADVRGSFTRGLAILLCLLVVLQLAALPLDAESTSTLRSLVLRYFALGLLVTALAHRGSLHGSLGIAAPVSLSWMVATLLPIGLLLAVALVVVMGEMRRACWCRAPGRCSDGWRSTWHLR